MMSLRLDQNGRTRRLGMIALLTILTCAVLGACQDDELHTMRESSADNIQSHRIERSKLVGRTGSSNGLIAIIMAIALIRALVEYARFVLMLLTDAEAARECYVQHCSVDALNHETSPKKLAEAEAGAHEHTRSISDDTSGGYEHIRKDSISTNMLETPSQMSGDDDRDQPEPSQNRGDDIEPLKDSICDCREEDYLVSVEDDVRKPSVPAETQSSRQPVPVLLFDADKEMGPDHSPAGPKSDTNAEADTSAHDPNDEIEVAKYHFRGELKPVTEINSMDTF